jgi:hypothetical protein
MKIEDLAEEDILFYLTREFADEKELEPLFERYIHHQDIFEGTPNPKFKWIHTGLRGKNQAGEVASFYFLKENKPRGKIVLFDNSLIPEKYREVSRENQRIFSKNQYR